MRVTNVIQQLNSAWQEVSLTWQDSISQRFQSSAISELNDALHSLDGACQILEEETENVNSKLTWYENL